jgi:hypothetical protein
VKEVSGALYQFHPVALTSFLKEVSDVKEDGGFI